MKNKTTQKGFSLIETFVAISILLVGIVGPLVLINSNLQTGRFSRNQITAYYLAQEAIEVIREKRDENFLEGWGFLNGLDACLTRSEGSGCQVDARESAGLSFGMCTDCSNLTKPENVIKVSQSTGEHGYTSSSGFSGSGFYRYAQVEQMDNNNGALVYVYVGFSTGRYVQEYVTTDYISSWYPNN